MKKTLATLLVLAMVASVCGMLFASAGVNEAVAELKAELEALVGPDAENAGGEWNIDITVDETGKVTAIFNILGISGKNVVLVESFMYFDSEKLTLLNTINSKDNTVDCVTLPDDEWENWCNVKGEGVICLSALNAIADSYADETNLVFTLEFQLAEGETLAGLYIPTGEDNCVLDENFEDICVNGAYGIVCTIVEEPHEHVYAEEVTAQPTLSAEGVITYTCECGDTYTKAIPAVKVQPETLEALPEGALVFDYAGYIHDAFFCIVAGDNLTVNDLTALGNKGSGKDMNYFYVAVVDEDNVVVETYFTLGRPDGVKSDVVCPAGGYIIGFNANKAGADVMLNIEVGAEITLYNIDVEALRGVAGNVAVKDAGFVFANPVVEEPDEPSEEPDEPSEEPSVEPDEPSEEPDEPSEEPDEPSEEPSVEPDEPSDEPSVEPDEPSEEPDEPSEEPDEPSEEPDEPSEEPDEPSEEPSVEPDEPSEEPDEPSEEPDEPSEEPSVEPDEPSDEPSEEPDEPSEEPSVEPDEPSVEPEEPSEPEGPITWEDTLVKGENGNYSVDVPYDYVWNVTYVNGTLSGEDITICTTQDKYNASNPKWAITILLEKQADGTYVAVQDAITGNGTVPGITLGEDMIALVVHSSASNDSNPAYTNWIGKVVAMSVKAGQVFEVAEDLSSVKAANPTAVEEPSEEPSVEPSVEPSEDESSELPPTSDAGVLVFAILGILAIAGAAVVIRVRS